MTATERREEILRILIKRKQESISNLAFELNTCIRTIKYDILSLSFSYPIYTVQGKGGGVFIDPEYYLHKQYLKSYEQECLEQMLEIASPEQQKILNNILERYSRPKLPNQ
jgi:predicted DNA-binding transcriptional regulator YafY